MVDFYDARKNQQTLNYDTLIFINPSPILFYAFLSINAFLNDTSVFVSSSFRLLPLLGPFVSSLPCLTGKKFSHQSSAHGRHPGNQIDLRFRQFLSQLLEIGLKIYFLCFYRLCSSWMRFLHLTCVPNIPRGMIMISFDEWMNEEASE